jgi:hypothetical protein
LDGNEAEVALGGDSFGDEGLAGSCWEGVEFYEIEGFFEFLNFLKNF